VVRTAFLIASSTEMQGAALGMLQTERHHGAPRDCPAYKLIFEVDRFHRSSPISLVGPGLPQQSKCLPSSSPITALGMSWHSMPHGSLFLTSTLSSRKPLSPRPRKPLVRTNSARRRKPTLSSQHGRLPRGFLPLPTGWR
jgi:hypothetical protein